MICSTLPRRIALWLTRLSKFRQPHGGQVASWTGGCRTGWNGGAGYTVQTAVNGGSELLIFAP
jgi:hypothetical protein